LQLRAKGRTEEVAQSNVAHVLGSRRRAPGWRGTRILVLATGRLSGTSANADVTGLDTGLFGEICWTRTAGWTCRIAKPVQVPVRLRLKDSEPLTVCQPLTDSWPPSGSQPPSSILTAAQKKRADWCRLAWVRHAGDVLLHHIFRGELGQDLARRTLRTNLAVANDIISKRRPLVSVNDS